VIAFLAPGFLLAGAAAALVPLVLHMLARTPPERRPLPTARFLTPDRRTRLRLRAPAQRWLLALRMLLLVVLGAAFARPEWRPAREGHQLIVLLDAGPAMTPAWDAAVDAAAARLASYGGGGSVVVFDSTAAIFRSPTAALFDSLRGAPPTGAEAEYLAALRGLRAAASALDADSVMAALITRPRWGAWSPAVPPVRAAAWPAVLELIDPGTAGREDAPRPGAPVLDGGPIVDGGPTEHAPRAVRLLAAPDHPLRPYLQAALGALGHQVADDGEGERGPADVAVAVGADALPGGPGAPDLPGAPGAPAALRTVIVLGAEGRTPPSAVWGGSTAPVGETGRIVLPAGVVVPGWRRLPGTPTRAAHVLAVWDDGRPAAAATRGDPPCVAYLAAEATPVAAAADPAFPSLLAVLLAGCENGSDPSEPRVDDSPLDDGAMAVLRGAGMPAGVRLADVGAAPARPLARLLLALALLVALVETAVAYARPRRR
jgi:hypothetical protein